MHRAGSVAARETASPTPGDGPAGVPIPGRAKSATLRASVGWRALILAGLALIFWITFGPMTAHLPNWDPIRFALAAAGALLVLLWAITPPLVRR